MSDPVDIVESDLRERNILKHYLYSKANRLISPIFDETLNEQARIKLLQIKNSDEYIPKRYLENWDDVALYHPKGDVNLANALIIRDEGGAYDLDNRLNDLDGKTWTRFTCSWFIFNALPSDLKEERAVSESTADHPATYSPTMMENFVTFFTKQGMSVLDPFAGIGSTLVACNRTGRIGYGVELNPKYSEIIKMRVPKFSENVFTCSSEELDHLPIPKVDFSISSPPYWDVLKRSTKDFHTLRQDRGLDKYYSDFDGDLGNIDDYEGFIEKTTEVYRKVVNKLKPDAYMVVIVKNVKKKGQFYPLAWDLAARISKFATLKDEKIWIQDKVGLAPYGYPYSWVSNILHHYCLIFQNKQ